MLMKGHYSSTSGARVQQRGATPAQRHVRASRRKWKQFVIKDAAAAGTHASSSEHVPVAITGAGIAGLTTAVALQKLGVPVRVLERAPALRQEGSAVALWSNAWRGLDALGVGQQLRNNYFLLNKVDLVKDTGKLLRSFTFEECATAAPAAGGKNETRGVMRAHLLGTLADQLPEGVLQFDSRVTAVSSDATGAMVQLSNGKSLSCDVLIGADGANSVVAKALELPLPKYAGYVAYRGLAKFPADELPVARDTIRQIYGVGVRAGMYPMTKQGDVYWFICFNADESAPRPSDAAGYVAEALSKVDGWAWGINQAVLNTDPETISRGSIRDRWTRGPYGKGCVTLAGDAAHPMTPNLGQGGCTAIEDEVVLARLLAPVLRGSSSSSSSSSSVDVAAVADVLRNYESERAQRTLPLTVRSNAFGAVLQLPYAPVIAARDYIMENLFKPAHFLDHTEYDCGALELPTAESIRV